MTPDASGGEKRILERCIREHGIVLTPAAMTQLDAVPEKFPDFLTGLGDLSLPAVSSRAA